MQSTPTVSIALPVYNDVGFIGRSLQGVAGQTFRDFQLIICDNASTDGTSEICQEFAKLHPFVKYIRHGENIGAAANFQFGLDQSRGKYFAWLASDDYWRPDFLSALVSQLEAEPNAALAFCPFARIDNGDNVLGTFAFDFSGHNAFIRVSKFLLTRDRRKDVPIYGLHRLARIREAKFYRWWGVNADQVLRGAYPFLAYQIAHGYRHVDRVLFESRSDPAQLRSHYLKPDSIKDRLALNLLEINAHVAMLDSVQRATGSIPVVLLLIPVSIIAFCITTGRENFVRLKTFLWARLKKKRPDVTTQDTGPSL